MSWESVRNYVAEVAPSLGNLRWLEDGQPPAELLALAVYPATPSVVWA